MRSIHKHTVIVDVESNALVNPDKVWTVVGKDYTSGEITIFSNIHDDPDPVTQYLHSFQQIVGHNFVDYDAQVLRDHCPELDLPLDKIVDTVVISRLVNYKQHGGHSLDAAGARHGYPKDNYDVFDRWSPELQDRCVTDVEITEKEYNRLNRFLDMPEWQSAIWLEHESAEICRELNANGFHFNSSLQEELHAKLVSELETRKIELQKAFPPQTKFDKEVIPEETKHGTLNLRPFRTERSDGTFNPDYYTPNAAFSRFTWEVFNPASPKQCVQRLNEAGWNPVDKTKTHLDLLRTKLWELKPHQREEYEERKKYFDEFGWKVNETNLATLPDDAPEAAFRLAEYILLDSRRSTLEEWKKAFCEADSRIHGAFFHIGSWTHRMSHSKPNCANIPSVIHKIKSPTDQLKMDTNNLMRTMWDVPKGKVLLGVDAEGIQLRMLAHYMEDAAFTKALIEGDKELGTDGHTINAKLLGNDISRDTAKTFIYAWILGAGIPKIAAILEKDEKYSEKSVQNFLDRYDKLKYIKTRKIPLDAELGYFEGIDKRKVICYSEHLMLAGYLQNGEAVVMKRANYEWKKELNKLCIPYKQVNFVHDEWQTELENDRDLVEKVAEVQKDSIRLAGEIYELNCPMAGSHNVGLNWKETH